MKRRAKRPYWESSLRVAHRVHRLWDFSKDPACALVGNFVRLGDRAWWPPQSFRF
jgi:hypothetical protein